MGEPLTLKLVGTSRDATQDPDRIIRLLFNEPVSDELKTGISNAVGNYIASAPTLKADNERLRDALENLVIAIGMGWDLDGVVEQGKAAIQLCEEQNDG